MTSFKSNEVKPCITLELLTVAPKGYELKVVDNNFRLTTHIESLGEEGSRLLSRHIGSIKNSLYINIIIENSYNSWEIPYNLYSEFFFINNKYSSVIRSKSMSKRTFFKISMIMHVNHGISRPPPNVNN